MTNNPGDDTRPTDSPSDEIASASSPVTARPWRKRLYTGVRRAGWFLAALCVVAVILGGVARLYYNNERIRRMVVDELRDRLPAGTALELRGLEMSLLSGFELHGFRVGPLPGFTQEIASFERVAVHWSFWDLLLFEVVIDEVAIGDLHVCLEEREGVGRNIDALIAAVAPANEGQEPLPAPVPVVNESFSFGAIDLPLRIEVAALRISDVAVDVLLPELTASVDHFNASGRFAGEGKAIDLDLSVGLGREASPATIHARLGSEKSPAVSLDATQFVAVHATSNGFGTVGIDLRLDTKARVTSPRTLPPLHVRGNAKVVADLLEQHAAVERCNVTVGEQTRLTLRAAADNFLAPASQLRLTLEELELTSGLDELTPWLAAFVDGGTATGTLDVRSEPIVTSLAGSSAAITSHVVVDLSDVGADALGVRASGLSGRIDVESSNGDAAATVDLALADLSAAGQRISGLALLLTAKSPLAPWLGGDTGDGPPAPLAAELRLKVRGAGSRDWHVEGATLSIDASSPVALLRAGTSVDPASIRAHIEVPHAGAGIAGISGVDLRVDARGWDVRGTHGDARLALRCRDVALQLTEGPLRVPNIRLDADLGARGSAYSVRSLSLAAAGLLALNVSGAVVDPASTRPRLDGFTLALAPLDLESALALLPEGLRPKDEIRGRISSRLSGDGTIPYADLLGQAAPPLIVASAPPMQVALAYVDYMGAWAQRFRAGLPFNLHLEIAGEDLTYAGSSFAATDMDVDAGFDIDPTGPRVAVDVAAAQMSRPESARSVNGRFLFSFSGEQIRVTAATQVGWYDRPQLIRPIENSTVDLALVYKIGGDFFLESLAVHAPDRLAELTAEGLVIKPVRILLRNGLQTEGLLGVEGELRWRLAFGSEQLEPLAVGLPSVQGTIGLTGRLGIKDGVAAIRGDLECDRLSIRHESPTPADSGAPATVTVVRRANGALPFDVRAALRPHPAGTALNLGELPIGGGGIWLLTSAQDIRDRPARPVHYSRLQPYRKHRGLTIEHIETGNLQLENIELDARLADGILAVDRLALHVLGGDVLGEMALQLDRNSEVVARINLKSSNIDASYFKTLNLDPGPNSELSANMDLGLLFGPSERDVALTMNITKIGSESFDRLLQVLSENGKDEKIEGYRQQLWLVSINEVAAWMRYGNLNIDLDYSTVVPGYRPIPRDMLRRYSTSGFLDVYLQPLLDRRVGPTLGW